MDKEIRRIKIGDLDTLLNEIPDKPEEIYVQGELPSRDFKYLCVVGSRKLSPYGKMAIEKIIGGLAGYKIAIISGLAIGADKAAHEAALSAGLPTVAVPGSGLSKEILYPRQNAGLAEKILNSGGALVSEFPNDFKATIWSFPQRNRIMAGLCDAVLLVEATMRSGTLITARLAADYNRELLAIPGSIFSENSKGTNFFLKLGATLVDESADVLRALGVEPNTEERKIETTVEEKMVLEKLSEPISRSELIESLDMDTPKSAILISAMEIRGLIKEEMGKIMKNF